MQKALIAVALLLSGRLAGPVLAQGCAMCATSASAQGTEVLGAINSGVLVLVIPSVGMVVALLAFVLLRRFD